MLQTEQAGLRGSLARYLQPAPNAGFYLCPLCGSGTGPHRTGAMRIGNDGVHCKCFACGFYGDIFDLVGAQYGLSVAATFEKTAALLATPAVAAVATRADRPSRVGKVSLSPAAARDYLVQCAAALPSSPQARAYLEGRGLSSKTIRRFSLGWDKQTSQVVLPYPGTDAYFTRRGITGEKRYYKPPAARYGSEPLFNAPVLRSAPVVFVVESPFCALSIEQVGGAAVALGGTGVSRLLHALPDDGGPALVLCLDNDSAGQAACAQAREALASAGFRALPFDLSPGRKDPNEALQADLPAFSVRVAAATRAALALPPPAGLPADAPSDAASQLDVLLHSLAEAPLPVFPSGFPALDDALDGGLHPGLYVLGAIASLGKTTFALQLADQLAASGTDVLFFSLEMSVSELLAKSLSRLSHSAGLPGVAPLSIRDILSGSAPVQPLHTVAAAYKTFSHRLYFYECDGSTSGVAAVSDALRRHVDATGRRPAVVIDYLQILPPADARANDKQTVDRAVFALKRLSRAFSVPVLAISSLNRENYTAKMSLAAFKESGAIEYSSDVLLGLQFRTPAGEDLTPERIDALKQAAVREVELRVLKNRNGRTGAALPFAYHAVQHLFREILPPPAATVRR